MNKTVLQNTTPTIAKRAVMASFATPRPFVVQTRLAVSSPGDRYEQEADRVADQVMRMPDGNPATQSVAPQIQRLCAGCEEELQRQVEEEEEEEEMLQTKPQPGTSTRVASPDVSSQVQSLRGGGQPLSESTRAFFEPRLGHDFSQVRVHAGQRAASSAQALNARAYTSGHDIAFAAGQFTPETTSGRHLLAHELTHVVQQTDLPTGRYGSTHLMRDVFQSPSQECSRGSRQALSTPAPSCCTLSMLREIWQLRAQASPVIFNAARKLNNPQRVREPLWNHFRIRPDDVFRIAVMRNLFNNMGSAIFSDDVLFMCRDEGDPACRRRRAAADNCSSTTPRHMWLCGGYVFASSGDGERFLFGGDWLKTIIHEYAHLGCRSPGGILAAGSEFYMGRPGYPPGDPDIALKNADSYAGFAMAVR